MEIILIIIGSLIVCLLVGLLIVLLVKKNNNPTSEIAQTKELTYEINRLINESNRSIQNQITEIKSNVNQNITDNIFKLNNQVNNQINTQFNNNSSSLNALKEQIEKNIQSLNKQVEERLTTGFQKNDDTFNKMIEQVTKITETQSSIDKLNDNVKFFSDVLTNKSARGLFGEAQLNNILQNIFGDRKQLFATQVQLASNLRVDAVIYAPEPLGNIPIDSKFPYENYNRMYDSTTSPAEKIGATKQFKIDIKKHINDISSKYIIQGKTANQAIMFIPAEVIFAEIYSKHEDLIEEARKKHVIIASPSNLVYMLNTLLLLIKDIEHDKHQTEIQEEIKKLQNEFKRFFTRWSDVKKKLDSINKSVYELDTTTGKIENKYEKIYNLDFSEDVDNIENNEVDLIE